MVKGVNKQIIEINEPDSIYFERAVFYLRPGIRVLPAELSEREADKILAAHGASRRKRRHFSGKAVIYLLLAAAVVAAAVAFLK